MLKVILSLESLIVYTNKYLPLGLELVVYGSSDMYVPAYFISEGLLESGEHPFSSRYCGDDTAD